MERIDISGNKYGRLTVISRTENKGEQPYWLCKCECGNFTTVRGSHLKNGLIRSCGCLKKEMSRQRAVGTTHGQTNTRLYRIWHAMKNRCSNQNHEDYKGYGGVGISVCKEWEAFEPFRDWAMANGYSDDLTLDRKDNNGNYEPSNCRWATRKEQANNRRTNHLIMLDGVELTLSQAAERLGVGYKYLKNRICRDKWSIEKVVDEIRTAQGL